MLGLHFLHLVSGQLLLLAALVSSFPDAIKHLLVPANRLGLAFLDRDVPPKEAVGLLLSQYPLGVPQLPQAVEILSFGQRSANCGLVCSIWRETSLVHIA